MAGQRLIWRAYDMCAYRKNKQQENGTGYDFVGHLANNLNDQNKNRNRESVTNIKTY